MPPIQASAASKLFCLSPHHWKPHDDWDVKSVGRYFLAHGPDLPVERVIIDGEHGYLLGWPAAKQTNIAFQFDRLGDMGGRWLAITAQRIIVDPLASYSCVYSPTSQVAAASSAVMPPSLLEPDEELTKILNLPSTDNWYPFGLTPYSNLSRLLPGQTLNLQTFESSRTRRSSLTTMEDDLALTDAADALKSVMVALQEAGPLTILSTAGNDSRLIIAANGPEHRVELITFTSNKSTIDERIAKQIGRHTGNPHKSLPILRDKHLEGQWFEVVGRCVAGASLSSASLKAGLDPSRRYLKGIGGEIGRRTNYHRPGDNLRATISPDDLVKRIHLPPHPKLHTAAEHWLASHRGEYSDVAELMEIVYRENRIGAWASPQLHGDSINSVWIFPMNSATIINHLRHLSPIMKDSRASAKMIVSHLWPELLAIPINPKTRRQYIKSWTKKSHQKLFHKG